MSFCYLCLFERHSHLHIKRSRADSLPLIAWLGFLRRLFKWSQRRFQIYFCVTEISENPFAFLNWTGYDFSSGIALDPLDHLLFRRHQSPN